MTSEGAALEERLQAFTVEMLENLKQVQVVSSAWASYNESHPPIGIPSDFVDLALVAEHGFADVAPYLERDTFPMPSKLTREGYGGDEHFRYWLSGLRHYRKVLEMCQRHGVEIRRIMDFGGSSGRVFRHFYAQEPLIDAWLCDFNIKYVTFLLKYYPANAHVFLNTWLPHFPLPDNFFDAITAFSVFTHIDQLEIAWLLEIRRVLRPGGIAYLTVHNDASWKNWQKTWSLEERTKTYPGEGELDGALSDRRALYFTRFMHYNCDVYLSSDYIRREWGAVFNILEIVEGDSMEQPVIVCQKALT